MHRLLGINAEILKTHTHRLTTFYGKHFPSNAIFYKQKEFST